MHILIELISAHRNIVRVAAHGAHSTNQLQLGVIISKLKLLSAAKHFHLSACEAVKRERVPL